MAITHNTPMLQNNRIQNRPRKCEDRPQNFSFRASTHVRACVYCGTLTKIWWSFLRIHIFMFCFVYAEYLSQIICATIFLKHWNMNGCGQKQKSAYVITSTMFCLCSQPFMFTFVVKYNWIWSFQNSFIKYM